MPQNEFFLLTRHWRDTAAGLEIVLWAGGGEHPVRIHVRGQQAVCFIPRAIGKEKTDAIATNCKRRALKLKTLDGADVDALYFTRQSDLLDFRRRAQQENIALYESDIRPCDRFLMERFITGAFSVHGEAQQKNNFSVYINPGLQPASFAPKFRVLSIDIETSRDGRLYSIAAAEYEGDAEQVFVVNDGGQTKGADENLPVVFVADEKSLLQNFFRWLRERDPDILIGWNVIDFDLQILQNACDRLRVPFDIARGDERAKIIQPSVTSGAHPPPRIARIPGRVVLDGIDTLRASFRIFENFSLEFVAQQMLGRGKNLDHEKNKMQEIDRLYRDAQYELARYNLNDCHLVCEIFARADLLHFVTHRATLTGLTLGRHGGSVAALDNLYLPRLHRAGFVAPDINPLHATATESSPGGHVLDSAPGLHRNVLLLDFKSLYPSIIRTFKVDPLGLAVGGDDAD